MRGQRVTVINNNKAVVVIPVCPGGPKDPNYIILNITAYLVLLQSSLQKMY